MVHCDQNLPELTQKCKYHILKPSLTDTHAKIIMHPLTVNYVLQSDLLQLPELVVLLLDFLLLLGDLAVTLLLLHTQFLDDVAVLQLLLGQLLT